MRALIATALLLGTAACGGTGSASVEGTFGSYGLKLNTVFGWIDSTEAKRENGELVFAPRDKTRLHIVMSGATYVPDRDLRFMSAAELLELARESQRNGSINLDIRNYHVFTAGGQLAIPNTGDGDAPRLEVDVVPGLFELPGDATYPATAPRFASKVTATLTLSEAGRAAGEAVAGTLNVKLSPADGEPATVVSGEITVELDAPLISERIAECNISGQVNDDECEPGFPRVSAD